MHQSIKKKSLFSQLLQKTSVLVVSSVISGIVGGTFIGVAIIIRQPFINETQSSTVHAQGEQINKFQDDISSFRSELTNQGKELAKQRGYLEGIADKLGVRNPKE